MAESKQTKMRSLRIALLISIGCFDVCVTLLLLTAGVALIRAPIPREWLTERVSIQEAEAKHMYEGMPFGYGNEKWQALKASMLSIDELWAFDSLQSYWDGLAGRRRYCVVRFGIPINCIVTLMN